MGFRQLTNFTFRPVKLREKEMMKFLLLIAMLLKVFSGQFFPDFESYLRANFACEQSGIFSLCFSDGIKCVFAQQR